MLLIHSNSSIEIGPSDNSDRMTLTLKHQSCMTGIVRWISNEENETGGITSICKKQKMLTLQSRDIIHSHAQPN